MTPNDFEILSYLNMAVLITADISHLHTCVEFNDLTLLTKLFERKAGAQAV